MYQVSAPSLCMIASPTVGSRWIPKAPGAEILRSGRPVPLEVELVDIFLREPERCAQQNHVAQRQRALRRDVIQLREGPADAAQRDRKSTRLNSSHSQISYAVFCLKKKKK